MSRDLTELKNIFSNLAWNLFHHISRLMILYTFVPEILLKSSLEKIYFWKKTSLKFDQVLAKLQKCSWTPGP